MCKFSFCVLMVSLWASFTYGQQSITGTTWLDANENGIRESSDRVLPQLKVELFNEAGFMIQFVNSDDDGNYSFEGLVEGIYFVKFEKKTGLRTTLRDIGDDNLDSDAMLTGFSEIVYLDDANPIATIDAGFRSSIIIGTQNLIIACSGEIVNIAPTIENASVGLTHLWSHDNSTEAETTITLDSNLVIVYTVEDEWELPVSKNILLKVSQGITSKRCIGIDLFNDITTPINLSVNTDDPGPKSEIDIHPAILGGQRTTTIELLQGSNASDINASSDGVFINNCAGCRTFTKFKYENPYGEFMDFLQFTYLELNQLLLDQGNVDVVLTITAADGIAELSDRIESEGSSSEFTKVFYLANFDNWDAIDPSEILSLELTLTTINESTDFKIGSFISCADEPCVINLEESLDICMSDSITLSPTTQCPNGLIYQWETLGFGREKTVAPTDTAVYVLNVFDQSGCNSTYTTTINVSLPPTLTLISPTISCEDDEIELEVIATGNPPFSYEWNMSDIDSSVISLSIDNDTFIEVVVTDSLGCQSTAQTLINVLEKPTVAISSTDSKCSQPTGSVTAEITGGTTPYTINWSNGESDVSALTNVDAGLYVVEIIDANGCTTTDSATISYLPCAQIGNYVWHDVNYNGTQDASDEPLEGVKVLLLDAQGEEISSDTTNADGAYLFLDLVAGDYIVEFEAPTDYYPTLQNNIADTELDSDMDTSTFRSKLITLTENEKNLTIDAGMYQQVCIGDQVWDDINLNNMLDSEDIGIEDILVKLYNCDDSLLDSTLTDTDGLYEFCNLDPGSYYLVYCNYEGYFPVIPGVGDESIDSDIDEETASTECKTLTSGEILDDCDAGFVHYASLGDYVWHDLNADGLQDSSDLALADIQLNLFSCDSILISSTLTNDDGYYLFDSLTPGNYYLEVILPSDAILTSDSIGNNSAIDSDFTIENNTTSCITLIGGNNITDIDVGIYFTASLGNQVWIDENINGLYENEENGYGNLKIYLHSCDGTLLDSTYSNDDGSYLFDELTPGEYFLSIVQPDDVEVTINNNTDDTINSDIMPNTLMSQCINLISEQNYRDLDIGIYQVSKIGDFVWFDDNGNGIQDVNETGVPNITVTLLTCSNEVISTTQTNTTGNYCFENIPYGDYIIHYDIPEPYYIVGSNSGMDSTLDSDANPSTQSTDCITVDTPNENSIDVGITTCSNIGGTAWFDHAILNDLHDPIENGVNGVKVNVYQYIDNTWNLAGTTYTGHKPGTSSDDGYWEMCVPPGTYYVQFSDIKVLDIVSPNIGSDESVDSDVTNAYGTNTTDIISVVPGVDNLDIGIGYKWKTSSLVSSRFSKRKELPTVRKVANDMPIFSESESRSFYMTPKSENSITVHPNPSTGIFYLKDTDKKVFKYTVYDSAGNAILQPINVRANEVNNTQINLEEQKPGVYYILVETDNSAEFIPIIKI